MNTKKRLLNSSLRYRGAAAITAVLFFVFISVVFILGLSSPVVRDYTTARDVGSSKGAYYLSEAGLEDAVYRIKKGITISGTEVLSLGGSTATTTITTVNPSTKIASSTSAVMTNTRRVGTTLSTGAGEDFFYAMQVGSLGLFMGVNATINGNVYSTGPVCAGGTPIWGIDSRCRIIPNQSGSGWPVTTSLITGTVVSTGTTGSDGWITWVRNEGGNSMYAGTIKNSVISGSAYCNTNYMTTPSSCGTLPSLPILDFPISGADITAFETAATAGGVQGGSCVLWNTYEISASTNIGPKKYPCHLKINGPTSGPAITITLQGPVWVEGNIDLIGKVNVRIDPTYTGQSIPLIADMANNWNSRILMQDGYPKTFTGAGTNSWVVLISTKTSSAPEENENSAIWGSGNISGSAILYAKDGMVQLGGSASVAEISGKGVNLIENASLTYVQGLQDVLFYTGPSGSWETVDWKLGQ